MPATTQNTPLTLGILGCANIAKQFVRDVAASPSVRIAAVASRDTAKAEEFARSFSLPRHLGVRGHDLAPYTGSPRRLAHGNAPNVAMPGLFG